MFRTIGSSAKKRDMSQILGQKSVFNLMDYGKPKYLFLNSLSIKQFHLGQSCSNAEREQSLKKVISPMKKLKSTSYRSKSRPKTAITHDKKVIYLSSLTISDD